MSVSATESDLPRFFVGGEDVDELLDRARSAFDSFYDHDEDEDEEYDSVRIVFEYLGQIILCIYKIPYNIIESTI